MKIMNRIHFECRTGLHACGIQCQLNGNCVNRFDGQARLKMELFNEKVL